MVGLTELDSNKCRAILHQKAKQIANSPVITPTSRRTEEAREIDDFGEVAVKRLQQPYHRDFSDDDIKQIISTYKSTHSTVKLAKEFSCSNNTINKLLRQHGVVVTKSKAQAKLDAETVISMYAEMHTTEQIGEQFGVSSKAVLKCLRDHGVKIRNRWDYQEKRS